MTTEEMKQIIAHRLNQWHNCSKRIDNLYEKAEALMDWQSENKGDDRIDMLMLSFGDIINEDLKENIWDKIDVERYTVHAEGLAELIDTFLKCEVNK